MFAKKPQKAVHTLVQKPVNKLHGVYGGSIVWQHFVKGKTSFLQIVDNKLP
jgi:hypothetical protein